MRALVWQSPRVQRVERVPPPTPDEGEVLIAPVLVGICGSDITAHKGLMGTERPGGIRGHEFGARVTGSTFPDLPVGTRVAVDPVVTCGRCPACLRGASSLCAEVQIIGVHRPGGLGEAVAVPRAQLHPIPDSLSWVGAASAEPLAQAIHDTELARRGGRSLGRCLVIGGGTIGAWLTLALAQGFGAGSPQPAPVDVIELDTSRHEVLRQLGARRVAAGPADLADERYDTVFDVVGNAQTRADAVRRADRGGVVAAVGMSADEVAVPWFEVIRRELTLVGANAFTHDDYRSALDELIAARAPEPAQRRIIALEDAPAIFDALAAGDDFTGKTFIRVGEDD